MDESTSLKRNLKERFPYVNLVTKAIAAKSKLILAVIAFVICFSAVCFSFWKMGNTLTPLVFVFCFLKYYL